MAYDVRPDGRRPVTFQAIMGRSVLLFSMVTVDQKDVDPLWRRMLREIRDLPKRYKFARDMGGGRRVSARFTVITAVLASMADGLTLNVGIGEPMRGAGLPVPVPDPVPPPAADPEPAPGDLPGHAITVLVADRCDPAELTLLGLGHEPKRWPN